MVCKLNIECMSKVLNEVNSIMNDIPIQHSWMPHHNFSQYFRTSTFKASCDNSTCYYWPFL